MVHRIQGFTKAIATSLTSAATSPRGAGLAGRRVTIGTGPLTGPLGRATSRAFHKTPERSQLGALGSAPSGLVRELIDRFSTIAELPTDTLIRVKSASIRAGIASATPPVTTNSITATDSHKAAAAIHLTTNPANVSYVVRNLFNKSTPENPSSTVFQSVIKREPINPQKIKAQSRAANLAMKKETHQLHSVLAEAAKIRAQGIDKYPNATRLISSHLYDPSQGSIGRFNSGNLLPVVLGILYKAGEYDLVVRLMHDSDNSLISNDLPSMQMYVQSLLKSQYTNIHLINATIDHMQEQFGPTAEVLSLKAQINRIQADTAKLALDIHHSDAVKYKDGTPEIAKFLKAAEIQHRIVFPSISPENEAALEATRDIHEKLAITNYLDAYAISNNPKHGEEAIHIMRGIVLREKMLLERSAAQNPEKSTKYIEKLERKITEIQSSLDQLLAARSPHAHYKATVALSIFEAGLRETPTDDKKFLINGQNLIKACASLESIKNMMYQLGRHKGTFESPEAQDKIQTLLDILSVKLKTEATTTDECINMLFDKMPAAKAEILREEAAIPPSKQLMERSIFYGHQTGSHIPENFSRGGLVSTQQIGTVDFKVFREIVADHPIRELLPTSTDARTLAEVKDPDEAIKIMQQIVRYRFNNSSAELEIEISPEHQLMESRIRKEQDLAGYADKSEQKDAFDSHTSNVVTYAKGLGDCRIHAQSMQMYFTTWKALQIEEARGKISLLEKEAKSGHKRPERRLQIIEDLKELKQRETELNSIHLGTIQSDIYLSIERVPDPTHIGWTQPKLDKQGRFFLAVQEAPDPTHPGGPPITTPAPPKKKEEHVLTALFRTNPATKEVEISLADAFYQNLYPLGSGPLVPLGTSSDDGFSAGAVKGVHPISGEEVDIPVILHLSTFAGDRSSKSTAGEGQILLHGHAVDASIGELVDACTKDSFAAAYQQTLDECT